MPFDKNCNLKNLLLCICDYNAIIALRSGKWLLKQKDDIISIKEGTDVFILKDKEYKLTEIDNVSVYIAKDIKQIHIKD